jgi:hypothetical protein
MQEEILKDIREDLAVAIRLLQRVARKLGAPMERQPWTTERREKFQRTVKEKKPKAPP